MNLRKLFSRPEPEDLQPIFPEGSALVDLLEEKFTDMLLELKGLGIGDQVDRLCDKFGIDKPKQGESAEDTFRRMRLHLENMPAPPAM